MCARLIGRIDEVEGSGRGCRHGPDPDFPWQSLWVQHRLAGAATAEGGRGEHGARPTPTPPDPPRPPPTRRLTASRWLCYGYFSSQILLVTDTPPYGYLCHSNYSRDIYRHYKSHLHVFTFVYISDAISDTRCSLVSWIESSSRYNWASHNGNKKWLTALPAFHYHAVYSFSVLKKPLSFVNNLLFQ